MRRDQQITDRIIAMARESVLPWEQPWSATGYSFGLPKNGVTQAMYRGINIAMLEFSAMEKDYPSHEWASYQQWLESGKQIKKGEKGTKIVFFKEVAKNLTEPDEEDKKYAVLRDYSVFNACQLEGYEPEPKGEPVSILDNLPHVDRFIRNTGAKIVKGGNQNYYYPVDDTIYVVSDYQWRASGDQTALQHSCKVTFHEMGHWTGAKHRLDRTFGKKFGDRQYAEEEGVAELTSAFTANALDIAPGPCKNTAAYLKGWLPEIVQDNPMNFLKVSAAASKATDYLFALQKAEVMPHTGKQGQQLKLNL